MSLAISVYLAGFGLAWGSLALTSVTQAHELFWTIPALVCPLAWIAGIVLRLPRLLTVGFYGVVGLAVWAALSGAFPAGLGAVVLSLLAWDAAGLALWLAKADEVPDRARIWQALLLRACGLGLIGTAVALGFAQLGFSLPFWGLVGLLLAAWGVLVAFRLAVIHPHSRELD